MKRWISKDSVISKIGLGLVLFMVVFGIAGSMHRTHPQNAEVQAVSSKTSSATPIDLSEKQKVPVTETKIETVEETVPFDIVQTYDGTLPKDSEVVRIDGVAGKKTVKSEVKTKDGVEVSRALISESVTVPPVSKVVAIGTKVALGNSSKKQVDTNGSCDSHYTPCVKKGAGDLDCKDIGNQVRIVNPGDDPYNLDRDKDGIGCENYPQP